MPELAPTNWILLILLAAGLGIGYLLLKIRQELFGLRNSEPDSGLLVLQSQLDALREQVRQSLESGRLEIDRRLVDTQRVVGDVSRGLGEVDRQIRSVGETARDLRSLQELLRSPKIRGGMGELMLGELLSQVLPRAHFTLQYEFSGGERVDAVLRIGDGLVPVDSKFPLENFYRLREALHDSDEASERAARRRFRVDVRRHIEAIAKKYIRPGEGTYEFAMMYLPAEAVYQELIEQEAGDGLDLFRLALERQVVPVAPQSFFAYLQVIVLGMRGLNIEKRAREIMGQLGETRRCLERFNESFEVMQRHLGNAQRQGEEAGRRLARLESALTHLSSDNLPQPTEGPSAGLTTGVGQDH